MTRRGLIVLAAGGSLALLVGAFGFQMLGYAPCKLCLWQRWPHAAAVLIGALALWRPGALLPLLGALAALTTGGIGLYHTGVERVWWQGPDTCTSGDIGGLTPDQLMDQILTAPLIRCDEVAWQFLTLSMASWNMLISLGLAAIWVVAARRAG
ncbi:MAG: disulfide bond formation protein B [Paracoccaceae bacterium]